MRDLADLLALVVVDADAGTDVAAIAARDRVDVGATVPQPGQHRQHAFLPDVALVVERHQHGRRAGRLQHRGERRLDVALAVERAAARLAVDAFARDAVDLRPVPAHQRLPDVVVAEVVVLVVRRVEVEHVAVQRACGIEGIEAVGLALAVLRARQHRRQPQFELLERPRCPLLQVGHLHAGRRVDAIGGLQQRGQQHRLEFGRQRARGDRIADRLDAGAVLRVQEPSSFAPGRGEVAGFASQLVQRRQQRLCRPQHVLGIGLHVAARQRRGVGIVVVGQYPVARTLQCVADPRRAGEQVDDGVHVRHRAHDLQDARQEQALAADVFDHGGRQTLRRRSSRCGTPGRS